MDVLTLGEDNYRCIIDRKGRLRYRPISKKEAETKVCRINGKTTIKGVGHNLTSTTEETSWLMMQLNTALEIH